MRSSRLVSALKDEKESPWGDRHQQRAARSLPQQQVTTPLARLGDQSLRIKPGRPGGGLGEPGRWHRREQDTGICASREVHGEGEQGVLGRPSSGSRVCGLPGALLGLDCTWDRGTAGCAHTCVQKGGPGVPGRGRESGCARRVCRAPGVPGGHGTRRISICPQCGSGNDCLLVFTSVGLSGLGSGYVSAAAAV